MTTFALVQRETTRQRRPKADFLIAVPVKNSDEEDFEEHNSTTQQHRRLRGNARHDFYGDNRKIRFTSQIGLIYLKPVVGYSTSVYFYSKEDFNEKHLPAENNRYALTLHTS